MKVIPTIVKSVKVDLREAVEWTFKAFGAGILVVLNVLYYASAGKVAGGILGVIMLPHFLSLQFLLTLLSLLTLQLLRKGKVDHEIEKVSLFVAVLSSCYNVFVSLLLGVYSLSFF